MGVRVEVYWGIPGPLEPPGVIEGEKITEHEKNFIIKAGKKKYWLNKSCISCLIVEEER